MPKAHSSTPKARNPKPRSQLPKPKAQPPQAKAQVVQAWRLERKRPAVCGVGSTRWTTTRSSKDNLPPHN